MATVADMKRAQDAPSGGALIARARAMIPALKARARQCTLGGNVPAETIAEMQEAGFFRVLQPGRWGGYDGGGYGAGFGGGYGAYGGPWLDLA